MIVLNENVIGANRSRVLCKEKLLPSGGCGVRVAGAVVNCSFIEKVHLKDGVK